MGRHPSHGNRNEYVYVNVNARGHSPQPAGRVCHRAPSATRARQVPGLNPGLPEPQSRSTPMATAIPMPIPASAATRRVSVPRSFRSRHIGPGPSFSLERTAPRPIVPAMLAIAATVCMSEMDGRALADSSSQPAVPGISELYVYKAEAGRVDLRHTNLVCCQVSTKEKT